MEATLTRIKSAGIVAVIRLDDLTHAQDLVRALIAGGVDIVEFTLTNPQAVQVIESVRSAFGTACVVGAGSVVDVSSVDAVQAAGAAFVVSPVTSPAVMERCQKYNLPVMPGAYTPTEIQSAWEMGAAAVKVFPARGLGANYIKDILAPLPHLRLMPTSGINAGNIGDYIRAGAFAVGVGSNLVDAKTINMGDWPTISARARELVKAVKAARI